ncbi:MAG: hypothetical protein A3B91_01710 [Candidatus Yanofskybacteria bacterium RIFCSPHIGHO2_02_FULL_41_29]|uniref:Rod shape-determining protein MreD n=1 Tax=Candidatus Yanofskybacteria bacterium RIFCSPHIGHO2_01_FULL_41_53 TaxID=1802663 RepID=A0A1F8EI87_9BACT|nr:MAG: hypothetical protein A2650_03140 [Candidatus Yanofskybacteria bacterium RIFCSPHIGHO2_01_FULL_41_53]OGN11842.1 MAG: hypothetical protein A3B91_01710 [Candidatus Yanofskybacteria bacterium RIFCSPHIGHO2_02_FULL_41_29]OGN17252.1 MAG: hypothetical protein A3F48_03560 [Candidatus Yanofskybacteria bacterium RIFCSPHIGHO2_12_FULL_41_9]OGN23090.1 MAG: hypothetical protein A2916_05060 [Candidatus Yanofskybacteria bacterium RIFCSPLOWO2_01_FULL_41_67]OGN29893.1 MAG: hypothetical protein A3H54_03815 
MENLFLPALLGPRFFYIVPVFLLTTVLYNPSSKTKVSLVLIFLLITEIFSGHPIGAMLIPFIATFTVYLIANKYLNISSNLRENMSFSGVIMSFLIIALFAYLYSFFFIISRPPYDILDSLVKFSLFFTRSIFQTIIWPLVFTLLFKYVLKNK